MSVRPVMAHVATIERPVRGTSSWGTPGAPSTTPVGTTDCRMIMRVVDGGVDGEQHVQLERRSLLLPADADLQPGDIITEIRDRSSRVLGGPFRVTTVVRVAAGAPGEHKMAGLETITETA